MTLNVELDRKNTFSNNNKSRDIVEDMMDMYNLKDVWRTYYPEKKEFSWFKIGQETKASRIDFALVSAGMDQKVENCMYLPGIQTDHRAFFIFVEFDPFERGKGYWKFNNSYLKDKNFLHMMNEEIETTLSILEGENPATKWEKIKKRIKKTSIRHASLKVAQDNLIISNLSEIVNDYESKLPLTEEEDNLLLQSKADLEEKLLEKAKGLLFRSKARWYEEGEKNTKYFYSLEKARYNAKTCFKVITEQGQEVEGSSEILEAQRIFYKDLYSEDKHVKFGMTNTLGIKVPDEIQETQELQITQQEIEKAIMQMNNNKTPGQDGIPVDFYKVFWRKLQPPFMEMLLYSYEKGLLHPTAREGILNLIPKEGKDSRYIKNLRPITLLNVDYKIIEKCIANKMLPALTQIIHSDQRGFMKDRRISVNIRKMLDLMHATEKEDIEAVILSLDFVKCFDKCSFSILQGSLDYFAFGKIIKEWTKILYTDFTVKVQNNGHFSGEIKIDKGVHQGGCCSSLYFLVIAETLAISLRDNKEIEGLTIGQIRNLLNQFADDMDIFSKASEQSIRAICTELDQFHYHSGFNVSYDKTTLYRIGSLRHSSAQLYGLTEYAWSNTDIKVLGVIVTHEDLVEKNYNCLHEKVKKTLNAWYNRGLTLLGKVQVVNTLIASLFVYKMMVLPIIPNYIVKQVDNQIRDFLWDKKKSKIAYNILQNPKDQGGLNLVNLVNKDKSLKATWPKILHEEQEYASLVYRSMRVSALGEDIWRCRISKQDVQKLGIDTPFWEDVLSSWSEYNYYKDFRIENQIIWYNSQIRIRNKPFMWKDALSKGLKYVHQLFLQGSFKTDQQMIEQFGLTKLRYNGLKMAIPQDWKNFFLTTNPLTYTPVSPHNYDTALYTEGLASKVYRYISNDVMLIHTKYIKWYQDLGQLPADGIVDYGKEHLNIFKTTNVSKFRSFQYRLLQRAIVTNVHLQKWGITPDDKCYYCEQHKETLIHLFYSCPSVQQFWRKLLNYIKETFELKDYSDQAKDIIMNTIATPRRHIANFVCLIAKQFIYRQRCLKSSLSLQAFREQLNHVENIEKYIAIKNGKERIHYKKWKKQEE